MSVLSWDVPGSRTYETGIDRGVLYPGPDVSGVAWNGLTGVSEERTEASVIPYYLDGVKYLDVSVATDFGATLTAITYPEEFELFDGVADIGGGVFLDNQPVGTFGLCYRTRIGTDQDANAGYKLHLLYNLTAVPSAKAYSTMSKSTEPTPFSWTLSGIPVWVPGYRPTSHLIVNSRDCSPDVLATLEGYLYGDDLNDSFLPDMTEVVDLLLTGLLPDVPDTSTTVIFDGGGVLTPPDGGSVTPPPGDTIIDGGSP